ncbi:acyl-CoA dehydrogenase [Skermania piniformis]|uniref:Acyl-CoA dehydrogenase n=1 Tax=Skermania pinensis TaxID=39122 RepID=A0ABX8SFT7_9ACTN|nr:acyl-CoA dehydrogenase [Skermania piniformis]
MATDGTIATTAEQCAVQQSIAAWAGAADPIGTRRADPAAAADSWRVSWPALAELGVFGVAVPDDCGGFGGSLLDLAVMLEQCARELAGGPIAETALAGLAVARGAAAARGWCAPIVAGELPCAVVGQSVSGRRDGDRIVLGGSAGPVRGAAPGVALLVAAELPGERVWCLVDAGGLGVELVPVEPLDPSCPLGEVRFADTPIGADRILGPLPELADLAVLLAVSEAAGVVGWCLDTAVAYAKVREQFGQPIGKFQAVKHLCAGMLCRVESIRAVAWDAALAAESGTELPIAAAVAASVTFAAAVEVAKDCIQVLGGIGFTWEHDAHLYLRRVAAMRQLCGGADRWHTRVAELSRAGARRTARIGYAGDAELRAEIAGWVAEIAGRPAGEQRAALVGAGLLAPHWPTPYGRDADPAEQLVIAEELDRAGIEVPDLVIGAWALPTILAHGSPAQVERFVGPSLRGELTWCQLFSEPEAGSDLASLRTTATRVEGGWRLSGQKVWTSKASDADWGICLARTDRAAPKHRGITYFLVDMRSPGIRVVPLVEIIGEPRFNEVFLDDVLVPDECVVGAVNEGWKLANTTLANERVAIGGTRLDATLERLLTTVPAADAVASARLGALIATGVAGSLLGLRAAVRQLAGAGPGAESSVRKLVGVQYRQDVAEFAFELAGAAGAAAGPDGQEFLLTRCLSIAGGTTQVLRTVAAERILGLPR